MITLGLVSDSHIPDRMPALPEELFGYLAGVDRIFHTGDICRRRVLDQLSEVAPVTATRGNADWLLLYLPLTRRMNIEGVPVVLTHSHGGLIGYMYEKLLFHTRGYFHDFHYERILRAFPKRRLIIFGHTHVAHCKLHGEQVLINPGSLGPSYAAPACGPTAGKVVLASGSIRAEVVSLHSREVIQSICLESSRM